jgi:hypothetical protein
MTQGRSDINTYLPTELLREIFLYGIESNQMKSGHLASVCRHWRSIITTMSHLWSTLRVGTWTEREQVTAWLQRAYPRNVVIDTQRDGQMASNTLPFTALQDALASTNQWHELTISSLPPESTASQLGFQVAMPMNVLRSLHVVAGCVCSPPFTHLLDLVPTEAPLSELRLHPSFASAYFLQPPWFPLLQKLTVLIVNGRDIYEPFELLPTFFQLHTFEADHLPLPFYELNTNLPLICTLQKLHLRACSVQWMAGRQFPCLAECAILLPHHWAAVQLHEVELPSCTKLTYHGYPMTTVQYFHAPQMRAMELRSHDCKEKRVYQHLRHLFRTDGMISRLTSLHLEFQCSEQVLIKVLKYLVPLQELVLSIAHSSPSWEIFLDSLTAKPSTKEWHTWEGDHHQWEQWYSSQTWHTNVLPHLKYLGKQCPRGFSQSKRLDNCLLLRLVGWTRAQLTPPLEHLDVWEGRGITDDITVDYISTGYLDKHLGISSNDYDSMIMRGMLTKRLFIHGSATPLFQLLSTVFFRQLQDLVVDCYHDNEFPILPCLEQIKSLKVWHGDIPTYSLNVDLPLTQTLQWLIMGYSTCSWMLGRTFKALKTFQVHEPPDIPENNEGMQVDLPACTTLELWDFSVDHLHSFYCSNIQTLQWEQHTLPFTIDEATFKSLLDFLLNCPHLQKVEIHISQFSGLDSLIQFVFCDAWQQGVWRDIRSVEVKVWFTVVSRNDAYDFFNQTVAHQKDYEKWWNEFTVTTEDLDMTVIVRASV